MLELDLRTGLPDGYSSKIFCGVRNFGGLSLGLVLQGLGVKLALVPSSAGKSLSASEIDNLSDGYLRDRLREIARRPGACLWPVGWRDRRLRKRADLRALPREYLLLENSYVRNIGIASGAVSADPVRPLMWCSLIVLYGTCRSPTA